MTPSLIDHRPRGELVAELYDRHAAGLFAYCHDQLGDTTSAADALVAVLTNVPPVEPPRAALYALARREIYRRDVAYVFPSVDPATDPATALIERVLREVRPHQREVLLLSAVCGLDVVELAWVLDVAADTAEQLIMSARHRFTHSLTVAVTSARSVSVVPPEVAEVYATLTVASAEAMLARLPWRVPPGALRVRVLSAIPEDAGTVATAQVIGAKHLWPTTPKWPLPLAEPDPCTNTGVFPAKKPAPPLPGRKSRHEATTEPMPKVRGSIPGASGVPTRRLRSAPTQSPPTQPPPTAHPLPAAEQPFAFQRPIEHPSAFLPTAEHPSAFPPAAEHPSAFQRLIEHPYAFQPPAEQGQRGKAKQETSAEPPASATERGSSFGRALAAGHWPTLQRTLSSGRPRLPADGPVDEHPPLAVPSADRAGDPALARLSGKVAGGLAAIAHLFTLVRNPFSRTRGGPGAPAAAASARAGTPEPGTTPRSPAPAASSPSAASPASTTSPSAGDMWVAGRTPAEEADASSTGAAAATAVGEVPAAGETDTTEEETESAPESTPAARIWMPRPRRHDRLRPVKVSERHYDWLWELSAFILCVAIAMIVFFAMPMMITP